MLNGIKKKLTQLPEYQSLINSELDLEQVTNTANRFSRAFVLFEYGEEVIEFLDRSAKSLVTNVSTEPELSKIESLL